MPTNYSYTIAQCDVSEDGRAALQAYRDKRQLWLSWISDDEHHAIWTTLHSMVWTEVVFHTLTNLAIADQNNALNNPLIVDALMSGHVATQVLAIRRLMDQKSNDIISLRRLIKDIRRHFSLFTRENYICFDGLPYDYEAVRLARISSDVRNSTRRGIWVPTDGPEADGTSELAHMQFDKMAGIEPANRTRTDRIPISILSTLENWLDESGADELAKWSHAYLAHAGSALKREEFAEFSVTAGKIATAIKEMARATEAISAWLLFAGGRSNAMMPVAQFNQFDKLEYPIMPRRDGTADSFWDERSEEWNGCLDGVEADLLKR